MWLMLALASARPPPEVPEPSMPCDPHGHEPQRIPVPFPTLTCHVSLPDQPHHREEARRRALEDACDPTSVCASDCEALTAWMTADREQDRLLADLSELTVRGVGTCSGTDAEIWACLGRAPLPPHLGLRLDQVDGGIRGVAVVGPLPPNGPLVAYTLESRDHGCGLNGAGAGVRRLDARYGGAPFEGTLDLSGYIGPEQADAAARTQAALRADLARVPALVRSPPPACAELVEKLSNQQWAEPLWACFGLTPLPDGMRAMIRFHTRPVTKGATTTIKRLGMDRFHLEGVLAPSTPPLLLEITGDGVLTQQTDALASVDPRWRPTR